MRASIDQAAVTFGRGHNVGRCAQGAEYRGIASADSAEQWFHEPVVDPRTEAWPHEVGHRRIVLRVNGRMDYVHTRPGDASR